MTSKRARFDVTVTEVEAPSGKTAEDEPVPPWVREPARFVNAADVVRLRPAVSAADLPLGSTPSFTPEFLNQHFEDEAIALPEGDRPLRIEVLYGASSLKLHVSSDRPMEGAVEEVMYAFAAQLSAVESDAAAVLTGGPVTAADLSAYGDAVGAYTVAAAAGGGKRDGCEVRCGALSSSEAAAALNEGLQSLMRFEIDGHSPIDPTEERWRLFSVWNTGPEGDAGMALAPQLVGAATVFLFLRWIEGRARLVLKVCVCVCVCARICIRTHVLYTCVCV